MKKLILILTILCSSAVMGLDRVKLLNSLSTDNLYIVSKDNLDIKFQKGKDNVDYMTFYDVQSRVGKRKAYFIGKIKANANDQMAKVIENSITSTEDNIICFVIKYGEKNRNIRDIKDLFFGSELDQVLKKVNNKIEVIKSKVKKAKE